MNKRYLTALLVFFVGLDLALTFWQNYQLPLDGDLVAIVLPAPWYQTVLHDPFGWAVLTKHASYSATNRFFAHATMGLYWKSVPALLQRAGLASSIDSLYAASALFATAVQALLIFMLACYIRRGSGEPARGGAGGGFWLAAALVAPLFQTTGFYTQMGVTDHAVTYTFFYALPMALLLVLLWPFYRAACWQQPLRMSAGRALLLVGLMVVVAFNGPVATASVAVVLAGIAAHWAWVRRPAGRRGPAAAAPSGLDGGVGSWLSKPALALLAVLAALCLYSLYIGRANSENTHDHTLRQLYELLPQGIWKYFTWQPALPVLVGLLPLNTWLVRRLGPAAPTSRRVLLLVRWAGVFAGAYLLLLPLGGYRSYRPWLLRNDSILPVVLGLMFAYGLSTYYLLGQLRGRPRSLYLGLVGLVSLFFTLADLRPTLPETNGCQRWSLDQLARAPEPVVQLGPYCNVLSWTPITEPQQSALNAEMLRYWGVTTEQKLYFQK